jgi:hypothetical protein
MLDAREARHSRQMRPPHLPQSHDSSNRAAWRLLPCLLWDVRGVRFSVGGEPILDAIRARQRSLAAMIVLMLVAGLFGTPPVAFMIPAIVRDNLDAGAETLGELPT